MDLRMESLAAQFLPDYRFSEQQNNNELTDNEFLYNNIAQIDNLEENDCVYNGESQLELGEFKGYSIENNDYFMSSNNKIDRFSSEKNNLSLVNEEQSDESEAASKMLNYLISIEGIYTPDSNYLETTQHDISPIMRAILIDWMMEVWNEFTLKRETLYYSINYVDRFLSVQPKVKKEELQLIGVTAMFIASKMEEVYSPRVADFAKSTDNGYTVNQIVKMEKNMFRELGWYTTPPTNAMWANWYMNQWDIYISTNEYALSHDLIKSNFDLTFKSSNEVSYARFREVMQILDLIMLDYDSLKYKPRGIIASILYLIIGIHVQEFTIEMIWQEFIVSSNRFLNFAEEYNWLYNDFICLSFGFQINELVPTIQYICSFMSIPFNYDLPQSAENKNCLEGNFEEFLSYQTHHPLALEFIKSRIMNNSQ